MSRAAAFALGVAVLVMVGALGPSAGAVPARPEAELAVPALPWAIGAPGGSFVSCPPATMLSLSIALEPSHPGALSQLDTRLSAGTAGVRPLSEAAFESTFAPTPADVAAVEGYFAGFGATHFHGTPDRLGLDFEMPADGADHALKTQVGWVVGIGGLSDLGSSGRPALPPEISARIAGYSGLSLLAPPMGSGGGGRGEPAPNFLVGTGPASGTQLFVGSDYDAAYSETPLFPGGSASTANSSFPTGEAVATILMSGYDPTTRTNLPPFDPAAVNAYFNDTFPAAWPRPVVVGVPVAIGNVTAPPPGPVDATNDSTSDVIENSLDLEMAGSLAPGAEIANFYLPGSAIFGPGADPSASAAPNDLAEALSDALSHNYSGRLLASVSLSLGLPDLNNTMWDLELAHAEAVGVTVIASSGDSGDTSSSPSGSTDGPWPLWPATAAFDGSGVVAIGGTSLRLSGSPTGSTDGTSPIARSYDANITGISDQSAWYNTLGGPGNLTGSEGGASVVYREPAWQFRSAAQPAIASAGGTQGISALGRAVPDLALSGNTTLIYDGQNASGGIETEVVQGTSIGAPAFAGMVAELDHLLGGPVGFLDPELYRIASYFANGSSASPFLDVTQGGNAVFRAAPGWDAVTGWGGLDLAKLVAAIEDPAIANYQYQGPTPGLPSHGSTNPLEGPSLIYVVPIVLLLAGVVVIVLSRERRAGAAVPGLPPRPPPLPPGTPIFDCPYCGRPRPAEAVPCPSCGRL